MPPQAQNPQDPNQQQPLAPQPVMQQPLPPQQPVAPIAAPSVPPAAPSSWNTLFILALVFDVLVPIVGLILGEVLHSKAKAAGDETWRKKALRAIYFGCLVMLVIFATLFTNAALKAKHDTSSSSNNTSTSQHGTTSNYQQEAKDTAIKTDINAWQSALEASYASNGWYPSQAQVNDPTWRANNIDKNLGEDPSDMVNPLPFISGQPTDSSYAYTASPTGCLGTQASQCTSYVLSAKISTGTYTKNSAQK